MNVLFAQTVNSIVYMVYFAIVVAEPWIKKSRYLTFTDYLGTSAMVVAMTYYLTELLLGTSIVNTRVSSEGVHSVCMAIVLVPYLIFAYLPNTDTIRGMTLVVYLISLHEGVWNILFYGLVKPWLAVSFLSYGLPAVSVIVFTVLYSWKRYKHMILIPTIISVLVMLVYGWIWISIGFPITVSTFETPYATIWFNDKFVNMIEVGFAMNCIGAFAASYFTKEMMNR